MIKFKAEKTDSLVYYDYGNLVLHYTVSVLRRAENIPIGVHLYYVHNSRGYMAPVLSLARGYIPNLGPSPKVAPFMIQRVLRYKDAELALQ